MSTTTLEPNDSPQGDPQLEVALERVRSRFPELESVFRNILEDLVAAAVTPRNGPPTQDEPGRIAYSVESALTHFSQMLKEVEKGGKVTLLRNGEPVAQLVPYSRRRRTPVFGTLKGHKIVIDPNWDRPQNDLDAFFRGDV